MSPTRTAASVLLLVVVAGCRHHVAKTPKNPVDVRYTNPSATTQTGDTSTPPPSGGPSPGQMVVDALTAKGYVCTSTDTEKWNCTNAALANWGFSLSWVKEDAQTTIRFDSYVQRTFAHKCAEFRNHMDDLAVADDFYAISCDDSQQRFTFETAIKFTADVNVDGWVKNHIQNRERSQLLLSKTGASVDAHAKP